MLIIFGIYVLGWVIGATSVYLHVEYKAYIEENRRRLRPQDSRNIRPEDLRPKP